MAWEPEAPPQGEYIMLEAEDLPEGKKLTIIDDSAAGWDLYEVTEKDPFGVTLKDGRTVNLAPGDGLTPTGSALWSPFPGKGSRAAPASGG